MGQQPLVLVVEDEALVAMLIEDMLEDLGCKVSETADRLEPALRAAAEGTFDFAMIDVNLDGQAAYPVADRLAARGIPFILITGYGAGGINSAYAATPLLAKPFHAEHFERVVRRVLPTCQD
jgi:CheY-like chemotaxis protein